MCTVQCTTLYTDNSYAPKLLEKMIWQSIGGNPISRKNCLLITSHLMWKNTSMNHLQLQTIEGMTVETQHLSKAKAPSYNLKGTDFGELQTDLGGRGRAAGVCT